MVYNWYNWGHKLMKPDSKGHPNYFLILPEEIDSGLNNVLIIL